MSTKEKQMPTKASDYKHIWAWGKMLGSYAYYIRNEQEAAVTDNAPLDAVFKAGKKWVTFSEVENENTRKEIEHLLARKHDH